MNSTALSLDWEKICRTLNLPFRKRSTGVLEVLCPFHLEKTPSVRMWPKNGRFRCHGCGTNGDQIEFISKILVVPEDSPEIIEGDIYKLVDTEGQLFLLLPEY
jgi:hypothetical protein